MRLKPTLAVVASCAVSLTSPVVAGAQAPDGRGEVVPVRNEPTPVRFTSATPRRLRAPEGFRVRPFATGLGSRWTPWRP